MPEYPVGSVVRYRSYFGEKVGTIVDTFDGSYYISERRSTHFGNGCTSGPHLVSGKDIIGTPGDT